MKTEIVNNLKPVRLFLLTGMLWSVLILEAQFAPPVGEPGTTAISADSAVFIDWASSCELHVGLMDISNEGLGFVSYGETNDVIGIADNAVLSLGDGGEATCFFSVPLADGPGWDFAVFENSFDDVFLELAFVEVSSDGVHFVRFGASSLTQVESQVETFGILDARLLNNLAGKYRGGYGVPFDLNELKDSVALDINHIIAVRVVDVVGNISSNYASYDQNGHVINDPWPTAFETGGFDLDAIGVIHNQNNTGVIQMKSEGIMNIYPNPVEGNLFLESTLPVDQLNVVSVTGQVLFHSENQQQLSISTSNWPSGLYFVQIITGTCSSSTMVVKL